MVAPDTLAPLLVLDLEYRFLGHFEATFESIEALIMDQFNEFDVFDTVYPEVEAPLKPEIEPPLLPQSDASDASNAYHVLALPPLAVYPSRDALFEAIRGWAKPQGYAFTIGKSKRLESRRQKVYYACDRCYQARPRSTERSRST